MAVFLKRLAEKKIVDAATAVNATNADNVDGFSANEMMRVAFDSTNDAPDANGNAVLAFIAVPKAGWLILSGSIDGLNAIGQSFDEYTCSLAVYGAFVTNTDRDSIVHAPGGTQTNNGQENCSTTGVQQVTAGAHTIALTIGNRNTAIFREASVWGLYVPFDGFGNTP